MRGGILLAVALVGCGPVPSEGLPLEHQALRASMALRGVRPTVAEHDSLREGTADLPALVETWLHSEAFGATIRDVYAERLRVRQDLRTSLAAVGPLAGRDPMALQRSFTEAPLVLIERIVTAGRPFSDVVTTDEVWVDASYALAFGMAWDPDGPAWQRSTWADDRPVAGLLSHSTLWGLHPNGGANHNRNRANLVADALLCEDFLSRDVPVQAEALAGGGPAPAVARDPTCVSCHQALDPLAAHLFGHADVLSGSTARALHEEGHCDGPDGWACYPLRPYDADRAETWRDFGLRAPGYYGVPTVDITDVGALMAVDPRFAQCAVRTLYAYFWQIDRRDMPFPAVAALQQTYEASGASLREVARAIVLDPAYLAGPTLTIRPEQLSRTVADLTGFRWRISPDGGPCPSPDDCPGGVDRLQSDRLGFRAMVGGIDGLVAAASPERRAGPILLLALDALAAEAAGWAIEQGTLLAVPPTTDDDDAVRRELARLHLRMFGVREADDGAALDPAHDLFRQVQGDGADPPAAWAITLTGLLQDPAMVFY